MCRHLSFRSGPARLAVVLLLSAAGVLLTAAPALAADRGPYSMEILVDGVPLQEHAARGTTYVEAAEGREYSIRLTNRTSRRIAVALSVDGLNTIDAGHTSARKAAKWILGPHRSIEIDGWQTSDRDARRFFFTSESGSYGAWLGRTDHLGVVSAAVFRERRPEPVPFAGPRLEGESSRRGAEPGARREGAAGPSAPTEKARRHDAPSAAAGDAELDDDLAATGIGRRVDHHVQRVRFEAERDPAAEISVRYEFRDALVRLGVLPRCPEPCGSALARRERARGFADGGFAPDPYACCAD